MDKSAPKPWKNLQDQLTLLQARGAIIDDKAKALAYLERIGYYRLSGYFYPFRRRSHFCCHYATQPSKQDKKPRRLVFDDFVANVHFKDIVDLYVFDKNLRMLTLDALERIEISLRSQIAYRLGEIDPLAYLKPQIFHDEFTSFANSRAISKHHQWLTKQATLLSRSSEDFIKHHKDNNKLPIPIWVACEVWDFGAMSQLYNGMRTEDQNMIANKYGIENGRIFSTWLRALSYLRNVCAHHARLWNRNMVMTPKLPPDGTFAWQAYFKESPQAKTRVFLSLCICGHMISSINPSTTWHDRLVTLFQSIAQIHIGHSELSILNRMGLYDAWEQSLHLTKKMQ